LGGAKLARPHEQIGQETHGYFGLTGQRYRAQRGEERRHVRALQWREMLLRVGLEGSAHRGRRISGAALRRHAVAKHLANEAAAQPCHVCSAAILDAAQDRQYGRCGHIANGQRAYSRIHVVGRGEGVCGEARRPLDRQTPRAASGC